MKSVSILYFHGDSPPLHFHEGALPVLKLEKNLLLCGYWLVQNASHSILRQNSTGIPN